MTEIERPVQRHNYAVANVLAGNCTCKEEGTCEWCVIYYAEDSLLGGIILNWLREEREQNKPRKALRIIQNMTAVLQPEQVCQNILVQVHNEAVEGLRKNGRA